MPRPNGIASVAFDGPWGSLKQADVVLHHGGVELAPWPREGADLSGSIARVPLRSGARDSFCPTLRNEPWYRVRPYALARVTFVDHVPGGHDVHHASRVTAAGLIHGQAMRDAGSAVVADSSNCSKTEPGALSRTIVWAIDAREYASPGRPVWSWPLSPSPQVGQDDVWSSARAGATSRHMRWFWV